MDDAKIPQHKILAMSGKPKKEKVVKGTKKGSPGAKRKWGEDQMGNYKFKDPDATNIAAARRRRLRGKSKK